MSLSITTTLDGLAARKAIVDASYYIMSALDESHVYLSRYDIRHHAYH